MKILIVSMPSVHVIRWIENLSDSDHELYWFDVLGKGDLSTKIPIQQITNWKNRKVPYIKGEYFLQRKFPVFYATLQPFLEVTANEKLTQILNDIQPDLVHSFEMQSCSYPIIETMQKFPKIKWLYSCWGNDLFYYRSQAQHLPKIKEVLNRINYMHTDCERDFTIAKELEFIGKHVGVIPGGGGYDLSQCNSLILPFEQREIILVKGYHHLFGRALNVIKALELLKEEVKKYKIVVFGAHKIVNDYVIKFDLPFKVYDRNALKHEDVLRLMGQAQIYLGNNISDGMPNTLLEAMVMGAFPIQSNPGGSTAEVINANENGFLIQDPEDVGEIKNLILRAIQSNSFLASAAVVNYKKAKEYLDFETNQQKILALYHQIEKDICE